MKNMQNRRKTLLQKHKFMKKKVQRYNIFHNLYQHLTKLKIFTIKFKRKKSPKSFYISFTIRLR